ncbi:MAG: hypothetical protein CVU43_12035 [Chloroflexi bacterium HGW-Chloroflexi-5]|jgi:hypothetical protein|nr:MAG: hypothetical protein CVU43_12035 [Chloroflexi bacterium HGW-Chloroflexi-5]
MAVNRINSVNLVEVTDRPQTRLVDFNRVQVAPEPHKKQEEFKALTLAERQELLQKLINRVKSL